MWKAIAHVSAQDLQVSSDERVAQHANQAVSSMHCQCFSRTSAKVTPSCLIKLLASHKLLLNSSQALPSTCSALTSHNFAMLPLLADPELTRFVLQFILETPNGRRSVGRLARTCKTLSETALNILWKELDSLLPLVALFPRTLFKRARKPGLGFVRP